MPFGTSGGTGFYHGFGYGPGTGSDPFSSIPQGAHDCGGAVINNTGSGYKYVFTGSNKTDLCDPLKWQASAADAAGTQPSTLGNVNSGYDNANQGNTLELPCCERHNSGSRKTGPSKGGGIDGGTRGTIKTTLPQFTVYPIPASQILNFQYSLCDNITIKLTDVTGRTIDQQTQQNSTSAVFDVSKYTPGIYLYEVVAGGKKQTGKVVIE